MPTWEEQMSGPGLSDRAILVVISLVIMLGVACTFYGCVGTLQ